jgi:Protein of unknown function (DUF2961)
MSPDNRLIQAEKIGFSRLFLSIGLILFFFFFSGCKQNTQNASMGPVINLDTLLHEMVNRETLTRYPDPGFQDFQASSWDRAELNKNDRDSWFGNKDYNFFIRKETHGSQTEYVIMDAKGPGAITRWWIPQVEFIRKRILRVYIDGDPKPVIEERYENFINGSSFVKWPFAFTSSDEKDAKYQLSLAVGARQVGANLYLPIPFSDSCKVTLDEIPFYYSIDYRIYDSGTVVKSFSKEIFDSASAAIKEAGEALFSAQAASPNALKKQASLAQNQQIEIDLPNGAKAVDEIQVKMNSKEKKQLNRAAVVEIFFDDSLTVWAPVAEFFGGGPYARPVKNRNIEVDSSGLMIAHWIMPYQKKARVILKNFGSATIDASLEVSVRDYQWTANSMYFHSDWHEEAPLDAPPFKDWNYIEINGKGIYVGDVLTIQSVPKTWWGEGDEKIYIDGESFPSHLGTGTEDYYGYAWGLANYFNSPFISMPDRDARGKADWSGYNSPCRMRLLDDIAFKRSLKVDMEAWIVKAPVSFSVCCFWYGMPAAYANIHPDEKTILRKLEDFHPLRQIDVPGEVFPDPPENKALSTNASGTVRYVGDQLDLLEFRDKNIQKPWDGDKDNIIGTAGYFIFGDRILNMTELRKDSLEALPAFISAFTPGPVMSGFDNAFFAFPEEDSLFHNSGLIQVKGSEARKGILSFRFGKGAPGSLRLGIMVDNAGSFDKLGKTIEVTRSGSSDLATVFLARSNRVPDWYFFDLTEIKEGDQFTIRGSTAKDNDLFTIGAVAFDLIR